MYTLVYIRTEKKQSDTATESAAATGMCHAMDSGLSKFGVTPGGGGMAGTKGGSLVMVIVGSSPRSLAVRVVFQKSFVISP